MWFNLDARLSIASVSIPYGQRFITIDIEDQSKIVHLAAGNLFLRLTTEVYVGSLTTSAPLNVGTAAMNGLIYYRRYTSVEPAVIAGSELNKAQSIVNFDLYINNIFVNPEIKIVGL